MLKHLLTALLLLSLPLAQARAFVACPMDEAPPPASDCPCPHAQHGTAAEPGPADADHGDCCEVEFAPASTAGASASVQHEDFARKLAPHGDAAELVAAPAAFVVDADPRRALPSPRHADPAWDDGSRTFLTTGRLRL